MDVSTHDLVIFWTVLGLRVFIPLFVPRFPLPAMIAALVVDGIDQTIYQKYTKLPLENYQGYDKALDIYYLTIAYISTLRNWADMFAFKASRFLYYYRMVGVSMFEVSQVRAILFIFPNTFEYFFDFYEGTLLRWKPFRMTRRVVLWGVALIWIFIKLPQEWWIHVAQLDMTDFLKGTVFGVPTTATWMGAFANKPGIVVGVIVFVVVLVVLLRRLFKRLPGADWPFSFRSDAHLEPSDPVHAGVPDRPVGGMLSPALYEKIAMVTIVSFIFAQVVESQATLVQLLIAVAWVVVVNTAVSHWLANRGHAFASLIREFLVMGVVNISSAWVFATVATQANVDRTRLVVFSMLLTLLVTLYDAYRPYFDERFSAPGAAPTTSPTAAPTQ